MVIFKNLRFCPTISILTILTLSACNIPNIDTRSNNAKTNQEIEILQKETAASIARINAMRAGGQPGALKLLTVKSTENNNQINKISIQSQAGIGFDGKKPTVSANKVLIDNIQETEFNQSHGFLENLSKKNTIINVGCDDNFVALKNTTNAPVTDISAISKNYVYSSNGIFYLTATTVLLCNTNQIQQADTSIVANKLVLRNFHYQTGEQQIVLTHFGLDIEAKTIELIGENSLVSSRKAQEFPEITLPGFDIVTKDIIGDGHLSIQLTGNNSNKVNL